VVFADADPEIAIPGSAASIFYNQGEACIAGSRLYVQKDIFDEVLSGMEAEAAKITLGSGLEPETTMGPLISEEQRDRVLGYVKAGLADGAEAAVGGAQHGDTGYFVEPTILVNTTDDMSVVREEIFGPVVVAQPFDDVGDLIAKANATQYGLGAGIWTRDINKAHTVAAAMQAGLVYVNCYGIADPALPYGGFKQSGWGRECGKDALELYTEHKSVVVSLQ
jgi:phenylacetaldehyde dehydrogenase